MGAISMVSRASGEGDGEGDRVGKGALKLTDAGMGCVDGRDFFVVE